ncbi:uncharacterized protein LOC111070094 [Drosophila obscura]|uniref:uncharacterized protein LOC111070094 n=1 Tax=Drosophila obscura TaxID=7282 RepID=UPI001BB178D0|nr:uncharacterized protein LOC111070094 [Drosophila obscura]
MKNNYKFPNMSLSWKNFPKLLLVLPVLHVVFSAVIKIESAEQKRMRILAKTNVETIAAVMKRQKEDIKEC